MNIYIITMIDSTTGEVIVVYEESSYWPTICDPYYTSHGRTGFVLKVEKSLTAHRENIYRV